MTRKKKKMGGRKLSPVKAEALIRVFEKIGYKISMQTGAHVIMRRPGKELPLIIPKHGGQDVRKGIIQNLLKTAELDRDKYFDLL